MQSGFLLFIICTIVAVTFIISNLISSPSEKIKHQQIKRDLEILASLNKTLSVLNKDLLHIRNEHIIEKVPENMVFLDTQSSNRKHNADTLVPDSTDQEPKQQIVEQTIPKTVATVHINKKKIVLFTMDSIMSFEQNSRAGGAAGELIVRHSLEDAFAHLGSELTILRGDDQFNRCKMDNYDVIILDSWTWAAKGWVPKKNLLGHEDKLYILDFFGSEKLRGNSLQLNPRRILTAYGSPWNTFLGYYIKPTVTTEEITASTVRQKENSGVIWGKDAKHFKGHENMLKTVASDNDMHLYATATQSVFQHPHVEWLGHQTSENWHKLLLKSKFLIGLGNPLLGPSAIDAIANGCVFINPIFKTPAYDGTFLSQHPYAEKHIGTTYVCSYHEDNVVELRKCIQHALKSELKPHIPIDFEWTVYIQRVRDIFEL